MGKPRNWKYDNSPVGFYVEQYAPHCTDIIHFNGTKKKNSYNRKLGFDDEVWGWSNLLWTCIDLSRSKYYPTVQDVLAAYPNDQVIAEMMNDFKEPE